MGTQCGGAGPLARSLSRAFCLTLLLGLASAACANPQLGATIDLAALPAEARAATAAALAAQGVTAVRLPLTWGRVEPAPGRFAWAAHDAAVRAARANGLEVTLVLGPVAPWAVDPAWGLSPDVACFSIPKSRNLWERYVREAATRYRGQVRTWQIREQPNARNFRGSVPEYFDLLASAGARAACGGPAEPGDPAGIRVLRSGGPGSPPEGTGGRRRGTSGAPTCRIGPCPRARWPCRS